MAVINEKTILILGGLNKSDGAIFDPRTQRVTKTFEKANFGFKFIDNQHAVSQFGKVYALV